MVAVPEAAVPGEAAEEADRAAVLQEYPEPLFADATTDLTMTAAEDITVITPAAEASVQQAVGM